MRNLIVARYDEPIEWLNDVDCEIFLYNKGDELDTTYNQILLENVGREAHTYIYHILNEEPADWNIFIQANPFDHCVNPVFEINNLEADFSYLKTHRGLLECDYVGLPHHCGGLPLKSVFERILGYCPNKIMFEPGACFVLSKERWLSIEKKVYEDIYQYSFDYKAAYVLERLWGYLWK